MGLHHMMVCNTHAAVQSLQTQRCEGNVAPDCGIHGALDDVCQCICEDGWTTQPFQAAPVEYCTLATTEGKQRASCATKGPLQQAATTLVMFTMVSTWILLV